MPSALFLSYVRNCWLAGIPLEELRFLFASDRRLVIEAQRIYIELWDRQSRSSLALFWSKLK